LSNSISTCGHWQNAVAVILPNGYTHLFFPSLSVKNDVAMSAVVLMYVSRDILSDEKSTRLPIRMAGDCV
jgi:hypothetical protein